MKGDHQRERSDNKKHIELFDRIAPVYRMFYHLQVRSFSRLLRGNRNLLSVREGGNILDIGCGTGALTYCLKMMNFDVIGIDASPAMIEEARRANRHAGISFMVGDIAEGLDLESKSFDLVIGSYIAHGLSGHDRIRLFEESKRLAREQILFHDFNQRRSIFLDFVEWLEDGDYFNFIYTGSQEMERIFSSVRVIEMGRFVSWYLCAP